MKITAVEKLEDCFDGSSVFLYHFDHPWTRQSILDLQKLGTVDYFPDFPRPFFRLRGAGGMEIKGVEGAPHCRVILPKPQEEMKRKLLEIFEKRE
jgi:hypothetical protein